ncbi:MAG: hypothetical protein RXO24_03760 [Acidilobus sp.]
MTQRLAQPALALGGPQGRESFAGLPARSSSSLQQPLMAQLQAGQPPTAMLFIGRGENIDEVKRRVIRELNRVLKELEPKLSRISDEEIVRLIREDREGLSGCTSLTPTSL